MAGGEPMWLRRAWGYLGSKGKPGASSSQCSSAIPTIKVHEYPGSHVNAGNSVYVQSLSTDDTASAQNIDDDACNSKDGIFSKHNSSNSARSPNSTSPLPPTADEIDNWNHHVDMTTFREGLQTAANAVFPNEKKSRYTKVSVLLLSWDDEDPRLPVSQEIRNLEREFSETYHFDTEHWKIPDENSNYSLAEKVMAFVKPESDSTSHLKILYYAGHARLMQNRTLTWTSWRNKGSSKASLVKWGAIQSFLEDAPNDALILLDCCASGTATSEGNGVTELISACAWNETANGVGPYSLTASLITELKILSTRSSFGVGELYRKIFIRTQVRMPENVATSRRGLELHPAPIHLVLTQVQPSPRSIILSVVDIPRGRLSKLGQRFHKTGGHGKVPPSGSLSEGGIDGANPSNQDQHHKAQSGSSYHDATKPRYPDNASSSRSSTQLPVVSHKWEGAPRLAFSVRLRETIKPEQDLTALFTDWLKAIPAVAEEVKVEAGFGSLSTLVIASLPMALAAYLPQDPAVKCLGPITSSNQIPMSMNVAGIDILSLLRSKTPEGTALRDSLAKYMRVWEESYVSSSKVQEDLLKDVVANFRDKAKSGGLSVENCYVTLSVNLSKDLKTCCALPIYRSSPGMVVIPTDLWTTTGTFVTGYVTKTVPKERDSTTQNEDLDELNAFSPEPRVLIEPGGNEYQGYSHRVISAQALITCCAKSLKALANLRHTKS